jgi:hypothetical protein
MDNALNIKAHYPQLKAQLIQTAFKTALFSVENIKNRFCSFSKNID